MHHLQDPGHPIVSSPPRIYFNHGVIPGSTISMISPMIQDTQQCHHLLGSMIFICVITSQDPFQSWCHHLLRSTITMASSSRIHDTQQCHHFPGSISAMVSSSARNHHNHDITFSQDPYHAIVLLSTRIQDTQWCSHLPGSISVMYHLSGSIILGAKYHNSCIIIVFCGHMATTVAPLRESSTIHTIFPLSQKWSRMVPPLMTLSPLWPFLMMSLPHFRFRLMPASIPPQS